MHLDNDFSENQTEYLICLSAFHDIAMTHSIPHFQSKSRLKKSTRMDLPKKPVPPMTKSVDMCSNYIFTTNPPASFKVFCLPTILHTIESSALINTLPIKFG